MKNSNLLKFILVGFIFAQVLEFQFNILITKNYGNWIFTLLAYPTLLLLAYQVSNAVTKHIKNQRLADTIYYFIGGAIGLFALEWIVIGNSPWSNPEASQIGMWSFWVAVFFMPRIFINTYPKHNNLKKTIIRYFAIYAIITTTLGILLPQNGRMVVLIWGGIISYTYMNIFYYQYIKKRPKQ